MDFKKRRDALDILKSIAIVLVVYGHIIQFGLTSDAMDELVYRLIYTFHMPLFMVLCGYFSQSSMRLSLWAMVEKKYKSLIIPCISWGVVIYAFLIGAHFLKSKSMGGVELLISLIWTDYWFLKATFICYILAWFCYNTSSIFKSCSVLCAIAISQILIIFNVPIMFPCFLVGIVVRQVIDRKWFVQLIPCYMVVYILLLIFYKIEYFDDTIEQSVFGNQISFSNLWNLVYIRFYRFTLGVSVSLFFIAIIRKYLWNIKRGSSKFIDYVLQCGRNSLAIYLIHTLFVSYFMQNFVHFDSLNSYLFYILILPFVTFLIVLTCILLMKVINKNRNFSLFLFGASNINKID